jgi:hypothetical protein
VSVLIGLQSSGMLHCTVLDRYSPVGCDIILCCKALACSLTFVCKMPLELGGTERGATGRERGATGRTFKAIIQKWTTVGQGCPQRNHTM